MENTTVQKRKIKKVKKISIESCVDSVESNTITTESTTVSVETKPRPGESELIRSYMEQLTPIELKALTIAQNHLGSSFNLVKSNGFCDWLKEQKK
jgi:hypothetical protein